MVIGVPSQPITVVEEDIHVCEVPILNSHTSSDSVPASFCTTVLPLESLPTMPTDLALGKPNKCLIDEDELPFDFLSGEEYRNHGSDLTDGIIYLTTYRLFIFTNESSCSFINCPIRLIDSIEIKDNVYLYVQSKEMRSFRLTFFTTEKCTLWLNELNKLISTPAYLEDLFAFKYALSKPNQERLIRDRFNDEFSRLQLDTYPWRITSINRNYELCTSYPETCIVPSTIKDEEIQEVAKFRSYRRFPTVVWR